jgi:hypothetical protein
MIKGAEVKIAVAHGLGERQVRHGQGPEAIKQRAAGPVSFH